LLKHKGLALPKEKDFMLYTFAHLFDIHLFTYISVRAGFAFLIAFVLTLLLMPKYLAWAMRSPKKPTSPSANMFLRTRGNAILPLWEGRSFYSLH